MDYVINFVFQLFYFVIGIGLIGFIIYLLNVLFYKLVGNGRTVCYASGLIGTPVHELSHALMCIIFRHKIEEIKLFQMDDASGTMGYVSHSYNPKSRFQRLGCFFIGVAPIICGSLLIHLLMWLLLPEEHSALSNSLEAVSLMQNGDPLNILAGSFEVMKDSFVAIFSSLEKGLYSIVFLLVGACIALHMKLSGADIKNALPAVPGVIILLALVNGVMVLVSFATPRAYRGFIHAVNFAGVYFFTLLLLSLCLTLICIAIALVIKGVRTIVGAIKRR